MNTVFDFEVDEGNPSIECLGMHFPNDLARREHFLSLLAQKLREPEFRSTEGFPAGSDAEILAMSDPPYYTACPNPFVSEFIERHGQPYDPSVTYSREPLSIDVSVGKTDALYAAHAYHTKVPHLAIVPSILHYTKPGDLVFDGFSGSGMTGIAAQWCGTAPAAYRHEIELEWRNRGKALPEWGPRRAVLNDLSPAATFIGANQNLPFNVGAFSRLSREFLKELRDEIGWMYSTLHSDGRTKGQIEYTVWSEVFGCPECAGEINFRDEAVDDTSKRVREVFPCPHCGAELNKDRLVRVMESRLDPFTGKEWKRIKFAPALIAYLIGKEKFEKAPDEQDLATLQRIESLPLVESVPFARFPIEAMYHGSRIEPKGITHVHHLFFPRALQAVSRLWSKAAAVSDARLRQALLFFVEQAIWTSSILNRFQPQGFKQVNKYLPGVYYVPSQTCEVSPWYAIAARGERLAKTFAATKFEYGCCIASTGSAANTEIPANSIDYVFTDPPFGENIFYADLNFLVEAWHGVTTNSSSEAIIDKFKSKALPEYQHLMRRCFAEYYRVLKPGRWMTVVFSNSKAAVWNAIQVALQQAGFVVAEVTALDKVQGSYRQVTSATAMKQDLVISAYKPNGGLEDRFVKNGATAESAWDFVETHLKQLGPPKVTKGDFPELIFNVERDPRRIKDRLDAWLIRHGAMVLFSAPEFIAELGSRFKLVDGMAFLPSQAIEYDKLRSRIPRVRQADFFVSDERSAIDWLTSVLVKRPSTRAEVAHEYIPQIGSAKRKGEIIPELDQLLEDNFIQYDGAGDVPSQIHSYLSTNHKDLRSLDKSHPALVAKAKDRWYVPDPNKAQDLEKKREKALLKEFEIYKAFAGRKIKESRLEVLRTGFRSAWANKDYGTIISVANKLPEETLQEDEKLLTLYDLALTRTEAGT